MKNKSQLALKAPTKNESEKITSAEVVCYKNLLTLLTNSSIEANSSNKRLLQHLGRRQNQTTFVVIGALRARTKIRQSMRCLLELIYMLKHSLILSPPPVMTFVVCSLVCLCYCIQFGPILVCLLPLVILFASMKKSSLKCTKIYAADVKSRHFQDKNIVTG